MHIVLIAIGIIVGVIVLLGLFGAAASELEQEELEDARRTAVASFQAGLMAQFERGDNPSWQDIKALAKSARLDNDQIPVAIRAMTVEIAKGAMAAPRGLLSSLERFNEAHAADMLIAAMPGSLTLPAARLIDSLGDERGLAVPFMEEICRLEAAVDEAAVQIRSLHVAVEEAKPGILLVLFALGFAVTLVVFGVGTYFGWLRLEFGH